MNKKVIESDGPTVGSLITVAEASRLRAVTKNAIWDLINRGKLRTVRQFNRVLLYRDEVAAYRPAKPGRPRKGAPKLTAKGKSSQK